MAKKDVLSRVREDLDGGRLDVATQRLRTLISIDPTDFDAYRMLAEVYRRTGNLVEAGRWGFLLDETTAEEIAAFKRAHPWPWVRLRLIRWTGDPATLPSAGRDRWQALIDAVEASGESGPADEWSRAFHTVQPPRRIWLTAAAILVLLVVGGLGSIGAIRMLKALVG